MHVQYSVSVRLWGASSISATNKRRGAIQVGDGTNPAFAPVELLLAAVGGCSAFDFTKVVAERGHPVRDLEVEVRGTRAADARLERLEVSYILPAGTAVDDGDAAEAVRMTSDVLCTVSRTLVHSCPVEYRVARGRSHLSGGQRRTAPDLEERGI